MLRKDVLDDDVAGTIEGWRSYLNYKCCLLPCVFFCVENCPIQSDLSIDSCCLCQFESPAYNCYAIMFPLDECRQFILNYLDGGNGRRVNRNNCSRFDKFVWKLEGDGMLMLMRDVCVCYHLEGKLKKKSIILRPRRANQTR